MPFRDIDQATRSDIKSEFASGTELSYEVDPLSIEGAADQKETTFLNSLWGQWLGYYKQIPELRKAIDAKATWTIGKGFTADPTTELILGGITGWGKDTFNTILENMIRTYQIGGDAFAEVIRNSQGYMINLKPLDPAVMLTVVNRQGIIIRYEQISKTKKANKKFQPHEIFHLSRNRTADEIHGISVVEALEPIILARNEAMADWRRVLHRNIDPVRIFHLDTDDQTTINSFKSKMDATKGKGENIYVPKGAIEIQADTVAPGSSLSAIEWIDRLNNYFFEACGIPKIIVGGAQEFTEASAKIAYLAFQQSIEEEQLYIEEQCRLQLDYVIELSFPASLQNELISDKPKIENRGIEKESPFQPNDTIAELEGNR